jgi:hypothetical protein
MPSEPRGRAVLDLPAREDPADDAADPDADPEPRAGCPDAPPPRERVRAEEQRVLLDEEADEREPDVAGDGERQDAVPGDEAHLGAKSPTTLA